MNIEKLTSTFPGSLDDLFFPTTIIHSTLNFRHMFHSLDDPNTTPFIGHLINYAASLLDSQEALLHVGLECPKTVAYGLNNQRNKSHYLVGDFSSSPSLHRWVYNNWNGLNCKIIDGDPSSSLMGIELPKKAGVCVYNYASDKEGHLQMFKKIEPLLADSAIFIMMNTNCDEMRAASYHWVKNNPNYRILFDLPTPVNEFPTWGNGLHVIAYERQKGIEINRRKKRVVILSHSILDGGSEEVIFNIAKYLDEKKYETSVAYLYGGPMVTTFKEHGIKCFEAVGHNNISRKNSIREYLNQVLPDYLFCNYLAEGHFIAPEGTKTIEIIHGVYSWLIHDEEYNSALRKAAKIVCVSPFVKNYMMSNYKHIDLAKLITINNGIDERKITPTISKKEAMLKYGIPEDRIVLGSLSRIVPEKGIGGIIEAARILNQKYPNLTFIIPGDTVRDKEFYMELKEKITKYQIGNILFPGFIKKSADLLQTYDVFIFPSGNIEGLQLSLVEAVKMGLPIITTNVGVVTFDEDMEDGKAGFVLNNITPELMAEKLAVLIENEDMRKKMAERNRKVFENKYTAREMVKQYEEMLDQLQ